MQCNLKELVLENLPAIFTIGPYIVEIYIYANRFADVMYTNCNCMFAKCMKEFFKTNCNGILQIAGKYTLAVWKQRNLYFCFDPYSRNNEGKTYYFLIFFYGNSQWMTNIILQRVIPFYFCYRISLPRRSSMCFYAF